MGLPHTFLAGDIARAAEVNDNFAYIMSLLGKLSTPARVSTSSEFLMGARSNTLLTGTADTGVIDSNGVLHKYFQIGWNADFNSVGGVWKFARFLTNNGASALRLGEGEMSLLGTSDPDDNLNSAMHTMMRIKNDGTTGYFYLPKNFSIQGSNSTANNPNDYRLTYTPLNVPTTIYDGINLQIGTHTYTATSYGVDPNAKMIKIHCDVVADTNSGQARVKFYQATKGYRFGFTVTAGQGRYGSGQGDVTLGDDLKFTVESTATFASVSAFVQGYWL